MSRSMRESRRNFLYALGGVCAGGAAYALYPQMELVGRLLAAEPGLNEYRALVCIYLTGGSDSFNMLVPYESGEYNIYLNSRGGVFNSNSNPAGLAIARDQLLPISDAGGRQYGLHPSCGGMKTLFDQGELSFLANVGTLAVPLSKTEYTSKAKSYPPELFSHNSQTTQWMRGISSQVSTTGWGGRVGDRLAGLNTQTPLLPPSISVTGGGSIFQTGASTLPYAMFASGPVGATSFSRNSRSGQARANALDQILGREYAALMENRFAHIGDTSRLLGARVSEWLRPENGGDIATQFPQSRLADQLRMIARMIKIGRSAAVGHKRQIFFAELGGFDTHRGQMNADVQPALLRQLSDALLAFRQALGELGALNEVTAFTMSDFARTLNSNGSGSDHGWGGVQVVMGGAAANGGSHRGGRVWGNYPLLELNGEQSLSRGQMVPTTSVTQFGATLANWAGVPRGDLGLVFPGLSRFSPDLLPILG